MNTDATAATTLLVALEEHIGYEELEHLIAAILMVKGVMDVHIAPTKQYELDAAKSHLHKKVAPIVMAIMHTDRLHPSAKSNLELVEAWVRDRRKELGDD